MLLTLFAVGTFWFWVFLVLDFCLLCALIANEKAGWATITMVATFAVLHFFGDFNVVTAVVRNPIEAIVAVAGYFVAGTAWSIAKWWFFVRNCREQYDELKRRFLERLGVEGTVVPENLRAKWKEELASDYRYGRERRASFSNGVIPKAADHKSRIMCWMCYWPASMVATLLSDWVKRIWNQIYLALKGLLESIAKSAFKGVEDDLAEPPAPPPPAAPDPNASPASQRGVQRGGAAATE